MICEPCSEREHRHAPVNGRDVDMEENGYVHIPSDGISVIVVTLWQCPKCKAARLESEVA